MSVNCAIEETVGFQLVQICKAHRNKAQEILSHLDLHPGQEMMLFNLLEQDGQTQHELAEQICVQPATMTKMVDRMVQAGFVQRVTDAEDQRVSRIHLSQKGRDLREPVQNAWNELEAISLSGLTTEERLLLRRAQFPPLLARQWSAGDRRPGHRAWLGGSTAPIPHSNHYVGHCSSVGRCGTACDFESFCQTHFLCVSNHRAHLFFDLAG